ncbi:hypothetical protein BCR44DRAFT_1411091 [Catenaria anguillulae PL171]|uniref:Sm protein B n=1 Tax=Catenaria anguillulae PL171 TaxID=765915 RepID=A0A1Y2I301_9FUNG|nr:hypothetical protein BCR44DRAFT_1411091 [Catenaria anguillulae PL171]
MMALLNYRLRVTISDGRLMIGQMLAFDRHMNLVLADTEEFRKIKIKGAKPGERREREEKRVLGLVILRGDLIVNFTIESPPPAAKDGPFSFACSVDCDRDGRWEGTAC